MTENKGLFHRIYDSIRDANRRYLEFGQLIKDIGYPLISTPYITYCDVRDDDMSVMYLLSLHTAYVLATTSSPFACDSISACQSAGNVVLKTRFLTAPKFALNVGFILHSLHKRKDLIVRLLRYGSIAPVKRW